MEKGIEKGIEKGVLAEQRKTINKLLAKNYKIADIAELLDMGEREVQRIIKS